MHNLNLISIITDSIHLHTNIIINLNDNVIVGMYIDASIKSISMLYYYN